MSVTIGGKRLLTVKDLAAWLGRTEGAIHWMIHARKAPPSAVISGRRMFVEDDCIEWLESHFESRGEGVQKDV